MHYNSNALSNFITRYITMVTRSLSNCVARPLFSAEYNFLQYKRPFSSGAYTASDKRPSLKSILATQDFANYK